MKLLAKTVTILLASFLCLLVASLVFYYLHVLREFINLEDAIVLKDASRVTEAIEAEREIMRVTAIDWAQWDDMYNYMNEPNEMFEDSWSTYESYKALRITDTLFLKLDKSLVFGVHVDFEEEKVEEVKTESNIMKRIVNTEELFAFSGNVPSSAIFVDISGNLVLAAASPILDSNRTKPSRGYMVIIKQIDEAFIEKIAHQTRLPLTIIDLDVDQYSRNVTNSLNRRTHESTVIRKVNGEHLQAYVPIGNSNSSALLLLRIDEERPVYKQGIANMYLFFWFWLVASITTVALAIVLLQRFVLCRLASACSFLNMVGKRKQFEQRLVQAGTDELAQLAVDINKMLDSLSQAHSEVTTSRRAAEQANFAKSMFIARVSHELRNPIHGIRGVNDLILRREASKAVRDLIKMGDLAAEGLLAIVDEILDFSKAEAGELTFERIPYDIRQVVRETMQVVAARLEGKYKPSDAERVELVIDVNPNVPQELLGDPTRLKQVLINLLTNAVKFTQRGFVGLRIEAEILGTAEVNLKIDVWDTGIGIPKEKLGTLFVPFKQVDESVARKYQGTGLGLSIVKQFTEGLGGTVTVKSVEGKGSTFAVLLPQEIVGRATSHLQDKRQAGGNAFPAEAIIVAKDSAVYSAMSTTLELLGVSTRQIDPLDEGRGDELSEIFCGGNARAYLVVVSEEALGLAFVWNSLERRIKGAEGCSIAILRPSSLDMREKLYSLGMEYVLSAPVLADDLLLAYFGELPRRDLMSASKLTEIASINKKLKVIIADDVPTNRIILEDMFEERGDEVFSVGDGKDIVELVTPMLTGEPDAAKFDLIITDITMATMNGDEAARLVRQLESKHPNNPHVCMIAITGHAFKEEQEQIRGAGFDGVLAKPMTPEMLAKELSRLFSSS